ncbi:hypothetical protein V3C99_005902, partial [Haemonchus contortus]|uniref:Ovule protein n=1 Tax=Haemonchus contortus TaxID=6289 RepID=A0A7I4XTZ7_HAECO
VARQRYCVSTCYIQQLLDHLPSFECGSDNVLSLYASLSNISPPFRCSKRISWIDTFISSQLCSYDDQRR